MGTDGKGTEKAGDFRLVIERELEVQDHQVIFMSQIAEKHPVRQIGAAPITREAVFAGAVILLALHLAEQGRGVSTQE